MASHTLPKLPYAYDVCLLTPLPHAIGEWNLLSSRRLSQQSVLKLWPSIIPNITKPMSIISTLRSHLKLLPLPRVISWGNCTSRTRLTSTLVATSTTLSSGKILHLPPHLALKRRQRQNSWLLSYLVTAPSRSFKRSSMLLS